MTPERWREIESLLDLALDVPAAERRAFLDAHCGNDPELRAAVERLLANSELPTPLPDSPIDLAAHLLGDLPPDLAESAPAPPERIGPYRIVRELGQGGMGTVYYGEREDDFRQRVAIKVLRRGLASDELTRRFRHERRILAALDHPNIARLFDGGVLDGAPYIVMEYVEGVPVTEYCRERGLGPIERLRLFESVCEAVQYAHQNLIVHRDLKPSNILVTPDGQVKLLDFGIAKLLDEDAAEAPLTRTGMHLMTPEYAAPEQVRGEPVTTATDVYALGVLMYELLVGERPYRLTGRSLSEIERVICEIDPPRPSTAVTKSTRNEAVKGKALRQESPGEQALGESVPVVPAPANRVSQAGGFRRGARATGVDSETGWRPTRSSRAARRERNALRRRLRGDIDTIVMKALQKDARRRYASAAALLDDVRRHRGGHPVLARPDSAGYRARKFILRNRAGVAVASLLLATAVGFGLREGQLRRRAEAAAQRAAAVSDFLAGVFQVSDPFGTGAERGEDVTARTLLDRGVLRIDEDLAGQPEARAEMLGVLGEVYANLGLFGDAEPLLRRSLEQRRVLYGEHRPEVTDAMEAVGDLHLQQGRLDEAESILTQALADRRAQASEPDAATARTLDRLATVFQERNDFAAAEPLFREALEIRERVLGPDHLEVAESVNNLALLHYWMTDYDEAERLYRRSLDINREVLGSDHGTTSITESNLAQVLHAKGEREEAESLFRSSLATKRRVFGDAHPNTTVNLNNLGALLRDMGRLEEAEGFIREALALDRQIFGDDHPYVAASSTQLGAVLRDLGALSEAEDLFRQAMEIARRVFGEDHVRVMQGHDGIGSIRHRRGDPVGAEAEFREARAIAGRLFPADHAWILALDVSIAKALRDQGRAEESVPTLRDIVDRLPIDHPTLRPQVVSAYIALGQALVQAGRSEEALPVLREGLDRTMEIYGESNWRTSEARVAFGEALTALRRFDAAEPLLLAAFEQLSSPPNPHPALRDRSRLALVDFYVASGRPGRADVYRKGG